MLRIVLIDGEKLFRDGLRALLEHEPDFQVTGEAEALENALSVIREQSPDVALFDVGKADAGLRFVKELSVRAPGVAAVAMSASGEGDDMAALVTEGVLGFVLKTSGKAELTAAVRCAGLGQSYIDPRAAGRLMKTISSRRRESDMFRELTQREKEIFYWLAQGLSNAEVAVRMVLSEKTVKNHVSHMLKKLDLRDRTQAAVLAWRSGFARLGLDNLAEG